MGVTSLLPLVFYISLLSNTVRDMARRGEGIRSEEEKERIGEQDGAEKNKELGENYPSFLLPLKSVLVKNLSQYSDYSDGSYQDAANVLENFPDTTSITISGIESSRLMSNHSLAKSVSLGNLNLTLG